MRNAVKAMRPIYIGGLAAALCSAGALGFTHGSKRDDTEIAVMGSRGRFLRRGLEGRHHDAANIFSNFALRQDVPQCGAQAGSCPGDLCCSSYGYCGDSIDYCDPLFSCQTQYGTCGWPRTVTSVQPTTPPTTYTPPPPTTSTSTTPPPPPPTTSSTPITAPTSGRTSVSTSSPPVSTGSFQVTTNGMCGNNTICIGNPRFGPCCSQFFWCGSTDEYCGGGCQSAFGACEGVPGQPGQPPSNVTTTPGSPGQTTSSTSTTSSTTSTSTSIPPTTVPPTTSSTTTSTSSSPTVSIPPGLRSSTDGTCGNGVTCLGSTFGRCCSQFGYCGDGDQFCPYIVGCQPDFGYCDPQPSS